MLNSIRVDIARLLATKGYVVMMMVVSILYPGTLMGMLWGLYRLLHIKESYACSMNDFTGYGNMAAFFLAIMLTSYLHTEIEDGMLRNKIIFGKRRLMITASYCVVAALIAIVMQVCAMLSTAGTAAILGMEFEDALLGTMVRYAIVVTGAGIVVAIFLTMMYLLFCNTKLAAVIPAAIAIITKLLSVEVLDKLYPKEGECTMTGIRLAMYTVFDRYNPFSYLLGELRWENESYIIGCMVFLICSLVIGGIAFSRKDLK